MNRVSRVIHHCRIWSLHLFIEMVMRRVYPSFRHTETSKYVSIIGICQGPNLSGSSGRGGLNLLFNAHSMGMIRNVYAAGTWVSKIRYVELYDIGLSIHYAVYTQVLLYPSSCSDVGWKTIWCLKGWLRILRWSTIGDRFLCAELLQRVRQCRCHGKIRQDLACFWHCHHALGK